MNTEQLREKIVEMMKQGPQTLKSLGKVLKIPAIELASAVSNVRKTPIAGYRLVLRKIGRINEYSLVAEPTPSTARAAQTQR